MGRREGKTVGNFNLPRVTKRLATPQHVEFVTALFLLRVKEKRRGKIVAIETRCGCMRARACLDGSKYRLTFVAP